jgi:glycine/D-amino acid oxidase-like deaminating enzyme
MGATRWRAARAGAAGADVGIVTRSLWLDEPYAARPALRGEVCAAVAIVGGGLTGASTAYWLAERGVAAVVLEAETVGAGATGRNAGFLLEGTALDFPELVARYGHATARALWEFTVENRRALLETCEREQIDCTLVACGCVAVAVSAEEMRNLEVQAALLTANGYPCDVLSRSALRTVLPGSSSFAGGLLNPRDVGLNPTRLVRGLAAAAERGGARIAEHTPVRALEPEGPAWRVVTRNGTVHADHVVLALNAYTALVDGTWRGVIDPVRGQVLATAPAPRRLFRHLFYANRGHEYWRQLPDGRIVLGGLRRLAPHEEVGTEDRLHAEIQTGLESYLRDLGVPPSIPVTHRWSGILGIVRDRLPLVGPVPGRPGLYIAGGYSGQGLSFAFLAGRAIADLITRGTTDSPQVLFPSRLVRVP